MKCLNEIEIYACHNEIDNTPIHKDSLLSMHNGMKPNHHTSHWILIFFKHQQNSLNFISSKSEHAQNSPGVMKCKQIRPLENFNYHVYVLICFMWITRH